jgi:predicted nucleic acid-binding Zn ribbon protein
MTDNHPTRPSRHDPVTTPCPACGRPFTPAGRQQWCSGACRSLAYRRRQRTTTPPVTIPTPTLRRPHTVYECDACGTRTLGQQRCEDCGTFMTKIGIGAECPNCDHPIAVQELVGAHLAVLK